MIPADFSESNCRFVAPPGLDESQVCPLNAYSGHAEGGSCDGVAIIVAAWKPTEEERKMIAEGNPIFVTMMGRVPPHFLSTSFYRATHPA